LEGHPPGGCEPGGTLLGAVGLPGWGGVGGGRGEKGSWESEWERTPSKITKFQTGLGFVVSF